MSKKVLVVGGVAGGASVAARVRRLDEKAEVIVFERGPHPSFSNCSLPNYLSRDIADSESLLMVNPDTFKNRYNIDVRVLNEVVRILPKDKKIIVKNLINSKEYEEVYDKLVISTGASAILPKSIKGIDKQHVFSLKNVEDIKKIDEYIYTNNVKNISVVGGGFIGLEVMENLSRKGFNITLIEASKQVMAPLDFDMVQTLNKEIIDHGVNLILEDGVKEITQNSIILSSGKSIETDMVIMAIGVFPETKLAKECGIEIGETGGIKVNHNYQTNYRDIYAVGDVIETHNFITGKKQRLALAGPAQKQARAAADHICGRNTTNFGVIGSSIIRVFDLNVGSTGLNEKDCQEQGFDYRFSYIIPSDKVSIMPDANPIFFKLIFEYPSGKILGAQALGKGNIDKRLDIIAAMLKMNARLEDLKDMEFCYAPYFSTAKDVTNHAALVGLNILNEEFKQVPVTKVRELVENNAFIVDVREESEFNESHLLNAKNIPLSQLRNRMDEIPKDVSVYLHCRSSQRSYNACKVLQGYGYTNVYNIQGSYLGICLYEYFEDQRQGRTPIVTKYNFK